MSGGSMNYLYCEVQDAVGMMGDAELDELIHDVSILLRNCEWWHSSDICEEDYRKSVASFKAKWFGNSTNRSERLEKLINEMIDQVRKECRHLIGYEE